MKRLWSLLAVTLIGASAIAQTTEYETGQVINDPWTGWSTPVTTNCSGTVNGVSVYMFSGNASDAYTLEITRQFTINSNDLDFYLTVSTQDATVSLEYSDDDVTYTEIGNQVWGSGLAQSTLVVPTYDPVVSTFYIKIKVVGTFGSPSTTQLNVFKIDAVLNSSSVDEASLSGTQVNYISGVAKITTDLIDYTTAITDMSGKLINYGTNIDEYDLRGLKSGIYFVTVVNKEGNRETFKINHSQI